jgi:hypothetical protein
MFGASLLRERINEAAREAPLFDMREPAMRYGASRST